MKVIKAPFPYFGGKSTIAAAVWQRLGRPKQYIEPFCGSAAMLLAAPSPASLEVVGDANGFIANFWRAVKHQPDKVAEWSDYPVSHIDQGARHVWLMRQRDFLNEALQDADWVGSAKVAGWWLWGQCCWIGSGWCDWSATPEWASKPLGQVPHVSDAGMGVQAIGKVPHVGNAGRGVQAIGKVPHVGNAGRGQDRLLTSQGRAAWVALHELADRLGRVRVIHGCWDRCLNHHYGADDTAVFFDPPYKAYESLYGVATPVAADVEKWCAENAHLRIALCGHLGDYDLPGWDVAAWSRGRLTYGGDESTDKECVWYSPGCLPAQQADLFSTLPIPEDPAEERFRDLFAEPT